MAFAADTTFDELRLHFQERVRRNELLAHHSAFGVGGPADVWVSLTAKEELVDLVRLCAERHYPLLIAGNGTNVLYADTGVRGIVARVALDAYRLEDHGDDTALLLAEAGLSWPRLLHELAPSGWAGLEFGIGIPGTLGGGVISNAGAHNDDLGQVLAWIEVLDARGINVAGEDQLAVPLVRRYLHDELDLGYRHSRFREQRQVRFDEQGHLLLPPRGMIEPAEIIMLLGIHVHRADPQELRAIIAQYKHQRQLTEPSQRHAGTVFKDPPGEEASHLIDQVGLRGKTHGQAQISERNANYLVNRGGAQAADLAALIMEAHRQVLDQLGVDLELDVELRGEWQV
ncbi:MAG TPA: UDP-N-acetylmuramate dehydrogenase [Ktedonobacteraceae bacterium]